MRIIRTVAFVLHVLAVGLFGQAAKPAQTPPSAPPLPGVTLSEPFYPFPAEAKAKFRDLEYENDQLEIENAKLDHQIEERAPDLVQQKAKNKARQAMLVDAMKTVAFEFASEKKIDLNLYEVDPAQVRFVNKKPAKQ